MTGSRQIGDDTVQSYIRGIFGGLRKYVCYLNEHEMMLIIIWSRLDAFKIVTLVFIVEMRIAEDVLDVFWGVRAVAPRVRACDVRRTRADLKGRKANQESETFKCLI